LLSRLISLLMLLSITFSTAERVIGAIRDGEVHHESSSLAATHAVFSAGEHGHEDHSEHGPEHKHGTSADHCTHQHGTTVPVAKLAFAFRGGEISSAVVEEPVSPKDHLPDPSFRPPQV
jgi:hypothetical protein